MIGNLWERIVSRLRSKGTGADPLKDSVSRRLERDKVTDLLKSRPMTLEQKYNSLAEANTSARLFSQLELHLFNQVKKHNSGLADDRRRLLRERGRTGDGRDYFFIQPLNQLGWLFETTSTGWVISRAQKIADTHSFVRGYETWDQVLLHSSRDDRHHVRVSSDRLGLKLASFSVYEQKLSEQILDQ